MVLVTSAVEFGAKRPFSAGDSVGHATTGQLQLDNAEDAEEFYRGECHRNDVNVNNSFSHQLLTGTMVFNFDNGYLGERGIVPVFSTLQRLAVVELSMRNCELSVDDIALLHKTFLQHKTLKKIDLRGVTLSVASARKLLALTFENPSITEVVINEDTPKYLSIQRQCFSNANVTIHAARCLVCARPVIHTPDQRVEGRLLLGLGEVLEMSATSLPVAVGIQTLAMFRCLLACCDANNGILFLCSSECREELTTDIVVAMRAVVLEMTTSTKAAHPKSVILRHSVTDTLRSIAKTELSVACKSPILPPMEPRPSLTGRRNIKSNGNCRGDAGMDAVDGDAAEGGYVDDDDEEDIYDGSSVTLNNPCDDDDTREYCTICGTPGTCLPETPLLVMRQICRDIKRSESGTLLPSALLRLTRMMVQYADGMRACSPKCVRHFVRFGLYGYGGVTRVRMSSGDPSVTEVGIPLEKPPCEDFAIVNFAASQVDEQEEEDITCALTVASAMTDIEGVPIDPYMIFAVGRHLAKMPSCALGVALRYVCEAVRMIGCLPVSLSPFNRQREKPSRASYINWSEWNAVADVHAIVRTAFSRRRLNVYAVEGPYKNLFDNIRAVLWTFRGQRRAVLVAMKFCIEWLSISGGVLPNEMKPRGGFLTTLKIVGQSNINNSYYLICQANFGSHVGNRGIFYIPRGLFNLYSVGAAYIFVDGSTSRAHRGVSVALYAEQLLPSRVQRLASETVLLKELFRLCVDSLSWQRRRNLDGSQAVCDAMHRVPPELFFSYYTRTHILSSAQVEYLVKLWHASLLPGTRSLRLFLLHELLGPTTEAFVAWALRALAPLLPQRRGEARGASELLAQAQRRAAQLQWKPLEAVRRALPVPTPSSGELRTVQRPEPRQVKSVGSRRVLRKSNRAGAAGVKQIRDPVRSRFEGSWSIAREALVARRASDEASRESRPVSAIRRSLLCAKTMANMVEEVEPALMGKSWHIVRLCTETGALLDEALFFIGGQVCCFNVVNQTVVTPLHSMLKEVSTVEFPFAAGFDCAMNAPTDPRVVYFFCGEYWFEWDAYWQTCIGGPFRLALHQQFAALPPAFHRGVDAVVPVPNTTRAIFFAQLQYIVFDCASKKTVGPIRRIDANDEKRNNIVNANNKESENAKEDQDDNPVIFSAELAELFPLGPMTVLVMPLDGNNDENELEDDIHEEKHHTGSNLRANKRCGAVMLIGFDGQTAIVSSFCAQGVPAAASVVAEDDDAAIMATQEQQPLPRTVLSRLPMAFRQMTTAVVSVVCNSILFRECVAHGCHIVDADSDVSATMFADASSTRVNSPLDNLAPPVSLTTRGLISRFETDSDTAAALHGLSCRAGQQPLLCDEVVLSAPPDAAAEPALVATDFGAHAAVSFGALAIILETTRVDPRLLRTAPLEAVVESSADGVGFVCHAHISVAPRATAVCWGEAPATRVWRLRFLSPLPCGAGIARLLWRPVACVPSGAPLDPTAPMCPSAARMAEVEISAPRLLAEPRRLIDALAADAVFASRTSAAGWRAPHCVLPVLGGPACLFFSGDCFVQLDCSEDCAGDGDGDGGAGACRKDGGARRVVALAGHPAFAALPYPFAQGIDAAFYPVPDESNIVALLRSGMLLRWNLDTGSPVSDVLDAHNTCFHGMPWPMDEVETIVQIWDKPGEVFVVRSPQVVRWSITRGVLLDGPFPIHSCPQLYHEAFSGKPLLCATAMPHEPCRYYVFCEDSVVLNTVDSNAGGECIKTTVPVPLRHFDQFSTVAWYLGWGDLRHDCVVRLDFREEQPLVVGIVMRSSEPGNTVEEWLVEYSDDNVKWNSVGSHRQCAGSSRTMWNLASVAHCAHRLWRLTLIGSSTIINNSSNSDELRCGCTQSTGGRINEEHLLLYTHLSLLTLEAMPYRLSARNIAFTGTLSASASELFVDDTVTIAFERSFVLAESSRVMERVSTMSCLKDKDDGSISETAANSVPYHITVDYGKHSPELMSFECHSIAGTARDVWSVWCSGDGEDWEHCGTWHSCAQKFKTSWTPRGPRQYWRIELYSKLSNIVYDKLCLFEYVGPSLTVEHSQIVSDRNASDPSLLWEKNSLGSCVSPVFIPVRVGTTIVLDTKLHLVSIVAVHLLSNDDQHASTKFAVEYSEDNVTWSSLDVTFLLHRGEVSARWGTVAPHPFWRLRIIEHAGSTSLLLRDVRFETAQPALYRSIQNDSGGLELNLTYGPEEIVAVQTQLPPGSHFLIEKLSLDGITWEKLGTIRNDDTRRTRAVRQGWVPQGSSTKWRLRHDQNPDEVWGSSTELLGTQGCSQHQIYSPPPPEQPLPLIKAPVEWLVFTGKAVLPVDFTDSPLLDVKATNFDEPQAARRLTDTTQAVVLRSSCQVSTASIAWSFSDEVAPRFYQVLLSGRTAVNPNAPPAPEVPVAPSQPVEEKVTAPAFTAPKTRRRTASVVVIEPKPEVETEVPIVKPMGIIVEISANGIDYVPVARRPFAQVCNALTWESRMTAPHWRVRFTDIPPGDFLELWRVRWMIDIGVPTLATPREFFPLSNSMHENWLQEAFNNEKDFCRMCREGYDQSRSVVSGLREPEDIERHGKMAKDVSSLRTKFAAFISHVSKEATKDQNPPLDKFISIGRPLSNDLMYLLYRAAKRYVCDVDDLNGLIAHPMLFAQDVTRLKEGLTWFYPKFELAGSLVESFYGFQKVRASFMVLWSLSLALQYNMDNLKASSIHPLSPHLASVLVTVKIVQENWMAYEHFPGLPLLYHSGFTEKPVVIVFAQNQVTFTSQYNLTLPSGEPFPALHPFRVFAGVNFIQRMPLTGCPCPIYDCLQLIYNIEFLSKYETEVVFNSISMNSNTASVRFTLPGEGINFALNGLQMSSIEFEVVFVDNNASTTLKSPAQTDLNEMPDPSMSVQRMTFVAHDATYCFPYGGGDREPISIAGYVCNKSEKITVSGISPSARIPLRGSFKDAFITDVRLSFELEAGGDPQTFIDPTLLVKGFLTTPRNGTYACCIERSRQAQSSIALTLQVPMIQLAEFIRLGDYMVAADSKPRDPTDWVHEAPIFLSAELRMLPSQVDFCGRGVIEFAGFRGEAQVAMTAGGTSITASLPALRIGGVTLQTRKVGDPVAIDIFAPVAAPCTVRIDGYSRILGPQPYPTRVELSRVGVMCVSSGPLYDICIEEDALFPSGAYAQVSVLRQPIVDELTQLLQRTPMIASILAKGVSFSFNVREVVAEPCMLDRQLLVLRVCGVLFGCYFDVLATMVLPENSLTEAKRICLNLLPQIIEQCDEALWAAYDMFVGLASHHKKPALDLLNEQRKSEGRNHLGEEAEIKESNSSLEKSEEETFDEIIDPVLGKHHVSIPDGEFLGRWLVRECEAIDKEMDENF